MVAGWVTVHPPGCALVATFATRKVFHVKHPSAGALFRPRWTLWLLSVVSRQNQRQNPAACCLPTSRGRVCTRHVVTGWAPSVGRVVHWPTGAKCLRREASVHRRSPSAAQAPQLLSLVSRRKQRQRQVRIERPEAGTRTGTTPRRTHPIREHRRGRAPSTARPAAVLRRTRRARPRLVVAGRVSRQSARVAPPADARHDRVFHVKHQSTGRCLRLLWAAVVAACTE